MARRGRPLMRAAMVGGLAYHAGKNVHQDTAPAPVGAISDAAITQLNELGQLKEAGVLTQEEFDAQKAHLLGA